jgi:shikimate dehydrogenase
VLQLGAGGAGRAVAFALMDLGVASLGIHDRDHDRARKLCADLGERARPVDAPEPAAATAAVIVNATPVGMQGHPGVPMTPQVVRAGQFVADVIYTPLETAFLKAAQARGARTMGGAGMCVHQAVDAFRHFSGKTPDIARMKRTFAAAAARREEGGLA